ncbi:hypothetical protein GGQ87_002891 [Brevundimonas alba]|uniref:DUF2927 domain-containing protein n=1 Tax=Brevundimonas alba TaxID=74314 RepID=A0A7X5YMD6_9CAUL|nr:hypothetical protein [Brevundimonas alba]NJC42596.1 hypothetical protein [Brevundimonas alba]
MSIIALLAAAMMLQDPMQAGQTPPGADQEPAVAIEDVIVEPRALEAMVREFVGEVGAPVKRRGLARWHDELCVGVVNVRPALGQAIADRISQVGLELGLEIGEPGCRANVFVIFASDGAALADAMVDESRRAFRLGVGGLDRGDAALEAFRTGDRPVRWWQISLPVNADTGQRAIRLPGDSGAPMISIFAASRLSTQIRDDLKKSMIIVDIDEIGDVNLAQLADYLAFVALVQADPEGETTGYDTILNLFEAPGAVDGLTEWDRSYLTSLYQVQDSPALRRNPAGQTSVVAADMVRDRQAAGRTAPAEPQPEAD